MLDHLGEVCRLPCQELIPYMDRFYYPLDKGIRLCEERGNYLAKAIFEERSGFPKQAFQSFERLLSGSLTPPAQLRYCVTQCIRICKAHPAESPSFWLRTLRLLSDLLESEVLRSTQVLFADGKLGLEAELQHVLDEMFASLPTTRLIAFFAGPSRKGARTKSNFELSLPKQLSIFQQLFVFGGLDQTILRRVLSICTEDLELQIYSHFRFMVRRS